MKAIYHLGKAVLLLYVRDPVTVLLSLVLLLMMMVLFGLTGGDEQFKIASPVVVADLSGRGQDVYKAIEADDFLTVQSVTNETAVAESIRTAHAAVGVVIDPEYKQNSATAPTTGIRLVEGNTRNRWTKLAEDRLNMIFNNGLSVAKSPVPITHRDIDAVRNRYIDFIFPGVLSLSILQICLSSATVLLHAKKLGVLRNLRTTPMAPFQLFGGFFCGRGLIIVLHLLVLTLAAKAIFHVHIEAPIGIILISSLLGVFTFTTMAAIIATVAPSFESGVLITQLLNFPMSFLCGVFIKMDSLPIVVRMLADALPLTYFVRIMRGLITGGATIAKLVPEVVVLSLWFFASLILFLWVSRLQRFRAS